jgi:hypothetical protein
MDAVFWSIKVVIFSMNMELSLQRSTLVAFHSLHQMVYLLNFAFDSNVQAVYETSGVANRDKKSM